MHVAITHKYVMNADDWLITIVITTMSVLVVIVLLWIGYLMAFNSNTRPYPEYRCSQNGYMEWRYTEGSGLHKTRTQLWQPLEPIQKCTPNIGAN